MKDLKPGQIGCFVKDKYNELNVYVQPDEGMTIGLVAIPFDLTAEQRKYINGEKRPAVEELQRIIENFYRFEDALLKIAEHEPGTHYESDSGTASGEYLASCDICDEFRQLAIVALEKAGHKQPADGQGPAGTDTDGTDVFETLRNAFKPNEFEPEINSI